MTPNLLIFALAALVPLIMGFIWYNPKVFGTVWMETSGLTEEKIKGANMPLVFILCYIFSFMMIYLIKLTSPLIFCKGRPIADLNSNSAIKTKV